MVFTIKTGIMTLFLPSLMQLADCFKIQQLHTMISFGVCQVPQESNGQYRAIKDSGLSSICSGSTEETGQLFLDFNEITPQGMKMFSMVRWTSLAHFSITCNKLGDLGCKYLSKASLPSLKAINLDSNEIGNTGISHLSKADWNTLQLLNLANNKIGREGTKAFLKGRWKAIVEINLSLNQLQYDDGVKLILLESTNIRTVDLKCNLQRHLQEKLKPIFLSKKIKTLRQ